MKINMKALLALSVFSVFFAAFAKGIETTDACTPGTWTHNLSNAQKYAAGDEALRASGFFLWCYSFNDGTCKHCDAADSNVFKTSAFKKWSKQNNIAILHGSAEDSSLAASKKFLSNYTSGGTPTPTFVIADGRDGVSRFGTCEFASGIIQNKCMIDGINLASFLTQVHAMLDHADDAPYTATKNGSKKLLNAQARVVTTDGTVNGLWNGYGTNTLNNVVYWHGKTIDSTYSDRYDWFRFSPGTSGNSYKIQGFVDDAKDVGRLCVFYGKDAYDKALLSSKDYEACLTNASEVVSMSRLTEGFSFTPATDATEVYFVFTRRAAETGEDITLLYNFSVEVYSAEAYYFNVDHVIYDETNKVASVVIGRTGSALAASEVKISVDESSTAVAGLDYSLKTNVAVFAAGKSVTTFDIEILERPKVLTMDRTLNLWLESPEPPEGKSRYLSISLKDGDVDVTPDTPENGFELPLGSQEDCYEISAARTSIWYKVSAATTNDICYVYVEPTKLQQGDRIQIDYCDAAGKVLRSADPISTIDAWSLFNFSPRQNGAAYFRIHSEHAVSYRIYRLTMLKPTVNFSAKTVESSKMAVPGAAGQWPFAVTCAPAAGEFALDFAEVTVSVGGGTAVAGEDFVAGELAVQSEAEHPETSTNAVTLLRAPGFRARSRTVKLSIVPGEFYFVGSDADVTLTIAADRADNDDGTRGNPKRLTIADPAGTRDWLTTGNRNLGATNTQDWIVIDGVEAGKTYRLAAADVALLPSEVEDDVHVEVYTNGEEAIDFMLTEVRDTQPFFMIPEDYEGTSLTCRVWRAANEEAFVQYNLKIVGWTRAKLAFAQDSSEVDDTQTVCRVELVRTVNLLSEERVFVSCDATVDLGTRLDRVPVTFTNGATSASVDFKINADGKAGVWTGDHDVTFTFEPENPLASEKTDPDTFVLTLKDTDPEYEEGDSPSESADAPLVSAEIGSDGVVSVRTLHGADSEDWFEYVDAVADTTYRFQVKDFSAVNADDESVYAEITVPGSEAQILSFADLAVRKDFPVTEDGEIAIRVYRETASSAEAPVSVAYTLEATKWQRAKFSFAQESYSTDDTNKTLTVTIRRTCNSESANRVTVTSIDGTAKAGAAAPEAAFKPVSVTLDFPAGAENDEQSLEVTLLPETEGYWTGTRTFELKLEVSDETIEQAGDRAQVEVHLQDVDDAEERKYDIADPDDREALYARSVTDIGQDAFRSTGVCHLNDDDLIDWYKFDNIAADQNYRFGLKALRALNADETDARVVFFVDGDSVADPENAYTNLTLGAFYEMTTNGSYLAVRTETQKAIYVCVEREASADENVSLAYEIVYRKAAPCRAHFVNNAVSVSEAAQAAYVDVELSLDEGQKIFDDVTVRVLPEAITALPGYDFVDEPVEVVWRASDPSQATGGIQRVAIGLTNYDTVWEGDETFKLKLESLSDADLSDGPLEMTVTLRDKDAGSYGTVGIDGVGLDESAIGAVSAPLTVREGDSVWVRVIRQDGKKGAVTGVWTWKNGKTAVGASVETPLFAGLLINEPSSTNVLLKVPTLAGYQASTKLTLNFALKESTKAITKGTPTAVSWTVWDEKYAGSAAAYSAGNRARVALTGGNWYWTVGDALGCPAPKAGSSEVLSASVKGPGILRFKATFDGAEKCTLVCKAGTAVTNVAGLAEGTVAVALPIAAGKQKVTISFTRPKTGAADTASAEVGDVAFEPAAEFRQRGTFTGPIVAGQVPGTATLTVSSDGTKSSGRFQVLGKTWSFVSAGWQGDQMEVVAKYRNQSFVATLAVDSVAGTVAVTGVLPVKVGKETNLSLQGKLYRDCWGDLPMTAEEAGILADAAGYYTLALPEAKGDGIQAEEDPSFGSGYLTLTVAETGVATACGTLADGRSVSLSCRLLPLGGGETGLLVYTSPSAYYGGWLSLPIDFTKNDAGEVVLTRQATVTPEWSVKDRYDETVFEHRLAVIGGFYDKTENLYDYYRNGLSLVGATGFPSMTVGGRVVDPTTWAGDTNNPVALAFSESGKKLSVDCDPRLFTISFNRSTGIFTGLIRGAYGSSLKSFRHYGVFTPVRPVWSPDDGIGGRGFFRALVKNPDTGKSAWKSYAVELDDKAAE